MNDNNLIRKQLKNAEGKRLLEKTLLEYSKDIIQALEENPALLSEILYKLEITEEEFYDYISGDKKGNISLYDQALCLTKQKTNRNNILR